MVLLPLLLAQVMGALGPRENALMQALVQQTEEIADADAAASDAFQQWCRRASPWAKGLSTMLEQQHLEAQNMQHQAEHDVARLGASRRLDHDAGEARAAVVQAANSTFALLSARLQNYQHVEEQARTAFGASREENRLLLKFAALTREMKESEASEAADVQREDARRAQIAYDALLTQKAQEVEMRSLEVQVAERQRARAKYVSEGRDVCAMLELARNTSQVMDTVCLQQAQEGNKLQRFLRKTVQKAHGAAGTPGAAPFSSPLNFLQLEEAHPKDAKALLHDIDALTSEDGEEADAPPVSGGTSVQKEVKVTQQKEESAQSKWCRMMRLHGEHSLMAQDAQLRHSKARLGWASTTAALAKEQAAYVQARRKEAGDLAAGLGHLPHLADYQAALDTYAHQLLVLTSGRVSAPLAASLGDLVETLEKTKSLLLVRDRLWGRWTGELRGVLGDMDTRLAAAFAHYARRQQEATADESFVASMGDFVADDLALQTEYMEMLKEVCPP